jgi:hypothetical protein
MAEKKFGSLEELDKYLDEKFEKEEELEEEFLEEEEETEEELVEDESEEEETVELTESAPETEEPISSKSPVKEEFAFGKLRHENSELKQKLEEQEKYAKKMREMATNLGYSSADDLITAYEEQRIQKEAHKKNIDPELYHKMVTMEKELETIKQREIELNKKAGIERFSLSLEKIGLNLGLNENEQIQIVQQMEQDGYTLDDIASLKNPERFIKGYAADQIAEKKYQEMLATEKKAKKLKEPKLRGETEPATDWEQELQKELNQYAKENNLYKIK